MDLSHIDDQGRARMVDVSGKPVTERTATAEALVVVGPAVARQLAETGGVAKGNAIETARIAGIMAAKRTHELIPMCHPLPIDAVAISAEMQGDVVTLTASVSCHARTGVEMEAMTAVAVAALTVYDMCKSAQKGIRIERIRLLSKSGGRSGRWSADEPPTGEA